MSKLGVNIDHVATLRNARGENHPNILKFADIAINSGADSITVHLREDRRHIKDLDLKKLCKKKIKINLEMACNNKMLKIALRNMPNYVCIVPEKRKEITTEGGIDLKKNFHNLKKIISVLKRFKIKIISSGGTFKEIKKNGFKCNEVSNFTKFKEMLDGRVKTLHPKIHAGILNNRSNKKHQKTSKNIKKNDLLMILNDF